MVGKSDVGPTAKINGIMTDETPKFISDTSSFKVSLYHQSSDQIISGHTRNNESCGEVGASGVLDESQNFY